MFLTIKEAAERVGLTAYTIRYYEREGLVPFLKRDHLNNRIFDEEAIHWLELLTCLRRTGMPLNKQKEIVELTKQGNTTIAERIAVLNAHKKELTKRQQELDAAFLKVEDKLCCYKQLAEQATLKVK